MSPQAGGQDLLVTISQLNAYRPRWQLLARVTQKSPVRHFKYKTKDGEGQMFSADLVDREGKETRAVFFGGAVDAFYQRLQEQKTFVFGGGRVKRGDKRFCPFDTELTFDEQAQISEAQDDGECPRSVFNVNLRPLAELQGTNVNDLVDVAAIIVEGDQVTEVPLRAGGSKKRVNWTLLDDSGASCRITLWGELAELPWHEGSVTLIKGAKVSDFGGRSLNNGFSSVIKLDAEAFACHRRAQELARWYAEQGAAARAEAKPLSNERGPSGPPQTIAEVKAEAAGLEPPVPGYDTVVATAAGGTAKNTTAGYHTVSPVSVTFLSHDRQPFYMSCPVEVPDDRAGDGKMRACNRKVDRDGSGSGWVCAADHVCAEPRPRWNLQLSIADHSGSQYVSMFDEIAQKVMGCEAMQAARLWEVKDGDSSAAEQFEQLFKRAQYRRWRMRLRTKKEVWNDEERLKVNVLECGPVSYTTDGRAKLKEVFASLESAPAPPGGA